jgi:hypothetical protein
MSVDHSKENVSGMGVRSEGSRHTFRGPKDTAQNEELNQSPNPQPEGMH